ncbi:Gfo/Idh/MocA family protein [Rubellimicrobium sp. CFH 75288]|uniref:Gfo/Idh/MocA family protein n=1 Tax=Rubellimicrobium sp. CFH 75288 TaxID=2697034 RepID=UPI001411D811|nr:Gfo/Idh/MocA family oxidoreductase [Rubellimicrobium sp. CFH 75288]NAZ35752.1 Gfo/Idh/MocA family oxidoreductase [Rubellimicrobium sp. CFH 75288]
MEPKRTSGRRGSLIGAGFFARNHLEAWRDLAPQGVRLEGICDRDTARAEEAAQRFGSRPFASAEAMLEAIRPDFVDIATTPPSHRPLVELCAPHVRLVICQKPLAEGIEDARAMVAACEAAGAVLLVHENFRWQKPFRRMIELLESGTIGRARFLRLTFRHGFDIYAGQPYLRTTPRLAIMDVGVHLFDLARRLMGEAAAVSCETRRLNPGVAGEDAFCALVAHADGGVSVTEVSFSSRYHPDPFPQTLALLEGDAGTIELRADYRLVVHDGTGRREENVEPAVPRWGARPWHAVQDSVLAFQRHALAVLDGTEAPQPSGADNLRTLALCLAAYESADGGRRVTLDPPPAPHRSDTNSQVGLNQGGVP